MSFREAPSVQLPDAEQQTQPAQSAPLDATVLYAPRFPEQPVVSHVPEVNDTGESPTH